MRDKIKILIAYLKAKKGTFKTRTELERFQDKQVRSFLKKIVPQSRFYRELYQGYDLNRWQELPLIDKKEMMDHFDTLNTVGISKEKAFETAYKAEQDRDFSPTINNITVGLSSGTSGNRGLFLVSTKERLKWAGTVLAKLLPFSIFKKQKIAFFLRCDSNLYQTVNSSTIIFNYFDLLKPLEEHITRLNTFQPDILVASPSLLRLLAECNQELHIAPCKIISVAEVLEDMDKTILEKAFNQPLHQVYQATEGFIAHTCSHGTLHLNEDLMVIQKEMIDEKRFIPIITDFNRTSQPIIRYRLNDVLTLKKDKCPCGSVLTAIEKIEGRCDDVFYFPSCMDKNELVPVFPDFISRAIICADENITDYKVRQMAVDKIEVYVNSPNFSAESVFNELCAKLNCTPPQIRRLKEYTLEKGKKLKRIERCFDPCLK